MANKSIEREAKLFEAGNYPDRGVAITEDDLDAIIKNTNDAPIRIEHTDTPFDGSLGVLKSLYRKGRELFGRLCFTQAAWELIKSANARKLSVAIKKDKSQIAEVSLVREPRIEDAAVFSTSDVLVMDETDLAIDAEFSTNQDTEAERLRSQLNEERAQSMVDDLKREGKISPAAEVFAKAILRSGDESVIAFGGLPTSISRVFQWFMHAQPKVIEFSELAAAEENGEAPEIFSKLGVTGDLVEKYRQR